LPTLNTLPPHEEHDPLVAAAPFFILMACGSLISISFRHFMQKAFIIYLSFPFSLILVTLIVSTPVIMGFVMYIEWFLQ
jgi:hypothetical protein